MLLRQKIFAPVAAVTALAMLPAVPAIADKRDLAAGVAIGVLGAAIVNDVKKKQRAREQAVTRQPVTYVRTTPTRKATRSYQQTPSLPRIDPDLQRALNAFDYNAGTPDGVEGRRTRAAVRAYQADLGDPQTGTLNLAQKEQLLGAYSKLKRSLLLGN